MFVNKFSPHFSLWCKVASVTMHSPGVWIAYNNVIHILSQPGVWIAYNNVIHILSEARMLIFI